MLIHAYELAYPDLAAGSSPLSFAGLEENQQLTPEWLDDIMKKIESGEITQVEIGTLILSGSKLLTREKLGRGMRTFTRKTEGRFRAEQSGNVLRILEPTSVTETSSASPAHSCCLASWHV